MRYFCIVVSVHSSNPVSKTQPLTRSELLAVLALSTVVFIAVEIEKFLKRNAAARKKS